MMRSVEVILKLRAQPLRRAQFAINERHDSVDTSVFTSAKVCSRRIQKLNGVTQLLLLFVDVGDGRHELAARARARQASLNLKSLA